MFAAKRRQVIMRLPGSFFGDGAPSPGAAAREQRSSAKPKLTAKRRATAPRPKAPRRPLLVIDGNSFAHRAYHALPKTILRRGDRPAGAILGFANFLLRFYEAERPRAVLVAWDTLDEPTYRHESFNLPKWARVR